MEHIPRLAKISLLYLTYTLGGKTQKGNSGIHHLHRNTPRQNLSEKFTRFLWILSIFKKELVLQPYISYTQRYRKGSCWWCSQRFSLLVLEKIQRSCCDRDLWPISFLLSSRVVIESKVLISCTVELKIQYAKS